MTKSGYCTMIKEYGLFLDLRKLLVDGMTVPIFILNRFSKCEVLPINLSMSWSMVAR